MRITRTYLWLFTFYMVGARSSRTPPRKRLRRSRAYLYVIFVLSLAAAVAAVVVVVVAARYSVGGADPGRNPLRGDI